MADLAQQPALGTTVTNRSNMLRKQIGQAPSILQGQNTNIQNQAAVQQQQQVQQAVAGGGPVTAGQIQQSAAQKVQQVGQATQQTAQKALQQQQQQYQVATQDVESQRRTELAKSSLQLDAESSALADKLNGLQQGLKNELFDKQLSFEKDELGRTLFNERQLMDYALETAKSEEELAEWQDDMQYYSQVRMQTLQAAQQKIAQSMEQAFRSGEFEKDANLKLVLADKYRKLQEKIQEEKNRQANRASMFAAGSTIAGAVAGGVLSGGNPAGAAVGASVGSAAGNVIASQTK